MFFSDIETVEKYNYLNERFVAAYKWLRENDLENLAVGKYSIIGEDVVANIQEYTTVPKEEKKFEAHDIFFDIQYLIKGVELFGICNRKELKEVERRSENDIIFYENPKAFGYVILKPKDMIVVAPEDAHLPGCTLETSTKVKKVVIKVRA